MDDILNGHIDTSIRGIERLLSLGTVIGEAINTPAGVTVIPITKLTAGIAGGSVDYDNTKKNTPKSSGGGAGTGITITPIAFLAVTPDAEVKLISLNEDNSIEKITSAIENAPILLSKIKDVLL